MDKPLSEAAKRLMHDSRFREGKKENDTVRLWENYREQALLWRALALLQIPVTIITLIFAGVIWMNRDITLNVPSQPLPGLYSASEIPDSEFLSFGESYINLVATYQKHTARKQFYTASEMLIEPVLSQFEEEMLKKELTAIEENRRSQIYYIDPSQTVLTRDEEMGFVYMKTKGERLKYISGIQQPTVILQYQITMKTIPRAVKHNKYGIAIVNINVTTNDSDVNG